MQGLLLQEIFLLISRPLQANLFPAKNMLPLYLMRVRILVHGTTSLLWDPVLHRALPEQ
jgi:hypothetical protein